MSNGFDPRKTDPQKLLQALLGHPAASGAAGGLAGSVLGSLLMGKGGGKNLARAGGLALVGAVAWKAWQQYQQGQQRAAGTAPAAQAQLPAAFDLESGQAAASGAALRVVQAMIAAAKADGVVDAAERTRIGQRIEQSGLGEADRQQVAAFLERPLDIDTVVRDVDSAELATEIYAASALAVHPASRSEHGYLDLLAARLGLEPALKQELDRGVESALQS